MNNMKNWVLAFSSLALVACGSSDVDKSEQERIHRLEVGNTGAGGGNCTDSYSVSCDTYDGPGQNYTDPSQSKKDPGQSKKDPGQSKNDPGQSKNDPSQGYYNDPSQGKNDPSQGKNDPSQGYYNDPSQGKNDPSQGYYNDPSQGKNDPSQGKNDPGQSVGFAVVHCQGSAFGKSLGGVSSARLTSQTSANIQRALNQSLGQLQSRCVAKASNNVERRVCQEINSSKVTRFDQTVALSGRRGSFSCSLVY